jgi:hypothetical protein
MNSLLIVIDLSSFQVTMKNQAVKEYCLNVSGCHLDGSLELLSSMYYSAFSK